MPAALSVRKKNKSQGGKEYEGEGSISNRVMRQGLSQGDI